MVSGKQSVQAIRKPKHCNPHSLSHSPCPKDTLENETDRETEAGAGRAVEL